MPVLVLLFSPAPCHLPFATPTFVSLRRSFAILIYAQRIGTDDFLKVEFLRLKNPKNKHFQELVGCY